MGEANPIGFTEPTEAASTTVETIQPIRGRDGELTAVGEQLDRLLAGEGAVLVIEGQAGMGKSRLLAEAATMARRLSMRVGLGAGDPGDTIVQLAPLMTALHAGRAPILGRDALRAAHTSPEQRYWLLQDIEALLEKAAIDAPIVICLDDLQWADSATVAALRSMPARLCSVPVGWFLAVRSGVGSVDVRAALDQIEQRGGAKVTLRPLDSGAVAQVTADLLRAEPDDALLRMATRADGSPYLLAELVSGLREEALVRVSAGRAQLVGEHLPDRLAHSMRRRLDRASERVRRVATVAASLGRRCSLSDVAVMLDETPSALMEPVDELLHGNVLVERDGRLAFVHDLTREAIRASVPVPVRRALDRQAATVLLAAGALPVEVAMQLAASAEPGDEVAITTLLKAAEAVGPTDPGVAADLSRRALELAPPNHPLRGPLVAGAAVWLHAAARGDEAKSFADVALRQVLPPIPEAQVRLSIASMFSISPDVRAASCRAALALPGLPPELRSRHHAHLFHNLVTAGRFAQARSAVEDVRKVIADAGDIDGRFILELAESGLDYAEGGFARALEGAQTALRTSAVADDETRAHLARQWHCDCLAALDRLEESLALSSEHVAAAQRDRQGWALRIFETGRARLLLQMGRLADAAAILEEQLAEDSAPRIVSPLDAAGVTALARTAIHLGDESSLRLAAQIAREMLTEDTPCVRQHGWWILALQAAASGDDLGAHQWLCRDEPLAVLPLFPMDIADDIRMVRIALGAHDHELAEATWESAAAFAAQNPEVASIEGTAAHTRGLLDQDPNPLERASSLFERSARPLLVAGALEDLGVVRTAGTDTDGAIEALSRSLVLFAETGAAWDAGRVRGRLRALGVRRRLVATHRPDHGWAALTDSELAVARLVAGGMTNREVAARLFVSPHTVSGHLRHVFTKLGITSRVELANHVAQADRP
ncbi:MAG: helix-turn-helix transcriptional regulator [Acidimicrobiales bacterium]